MKKHIVEGWAILHLDTGELVSSDGIPIVWGDTNEPKDRFAVPGGHKQVRVRQTTEIIKKRRKK